MSTIQPIITGTGSSEEDLGILKASEFFKLIFTKLSTIPHVMLPNLGFDNFELKKQAAGNSFCNKEVLI